MLLQPDTVRFGSRRLTNATGASIDRASTRIVTELADDGPHPVFADVPEQRTVIRVVRTPDPGDDEAPPLATLDLLTIDAAPTRSDAARRRVVARAILTDIHHELTTDRPARQTLTFLAVSTRGADDPVDISTPAPEPYG